MDQDIEHSMAMHLHKDLIIVILSCIINIKTIMCNLLQVLVLVDFQILLIGVLN